MRPESAASHLRLDEGLPAGRVGVAVHPEADVEQHDRGEQRGDALGDLAAGPAQRDHVGGGHPGDRPEDERRDPARVHVAQRLAAPRLDQHRDEGGQHQDGLEAFPQEDDERAAERGHRRQPRRVEPPASGLEQREDGTRLRLDHLARRAGLDQGAIAQHLGLDPALEPAVDRAQRRLHQLEALEIARDRELVRARRVALPVGGEALAEEAHAQVEGGLAAGRERARLAAEIGQHRGAVVARSGRHLLRGGHDQRAQVAQLAPSRPVLPQARPALPLRRGRGERAHVERQAPALRLAERREAGHGGALDAERDRVVEAEEAVLVHAPRVGEIGGRRGQSLGPGPVAAAGRAVADRAVGGEVGGGGGEVGHLARGDADLVEVDDAAPEIARDRRDLVAGALGADRGEEAGRGGLERGALGAGGQTGDHGGHGGGELDLLVVLALVQDPAVLDRARVVDGQVVERVQDGSEGIGLVGHRRPRGQADRQDQQREGPAQCRDVRSDMGHEGLAAATS